MEEAGYEDKVSKLKERNKRQKRELNRLRNENGTRAEQISRINEKINVLKQELAEREKEFAELNEKARTTEQPRMTAADNAETAALDDIDDLTIIEKFNNLLNLRNKEIEEMHKDEINYYTKQQNYNPNKRKRIMNEKNSKNQEKDEDPENDAFARSNIVSVKIKRILDGSSIIPEEEEKKNERKTAKPDPAKDKQGLSAVFRISSSTIFDELFKEACNFWGITDMKEYELIDETESTLCEKSERVENYFKSTQGHFNQYVVYLRRKINQATLSQPQKEAIKVETSGPESKASDPDFSRPPKREVDHYQQFFTRFAGLKAYIDVDKVKANERKGGAKEIPDSKKKVDDYSCLVFTIVLFLMAFTLAPFYQERDNVSMYFAVASIQNEFGVTNEIFTTSSLSKYSFQGIQSKADFYNFMNRTVANALFFVDPQNPERANHEVLNENLLVGAVRLRQMKVKNTTCTYLPSSLQSSVTCYPETYEDSDDVRLTTTLPLNTTYMRYSWESQWSVFKTASDLGQQEKITGWLANYDGSGYTVDIPTTISTEDMVNFTGFLQANDYISLNTKAVVLTFTLYNQAGEVFLYSELLLEDTPTGVLYPNKITVIPFRKSFRESSAQMPNHGAYDALRAICAVALNIFVLYRIFGTGKIDILYLTKFQGILNVVIIVMCYVSVGFNRSLGNDAVAQLSMSDILQSTSYIDMKHLAIGYQKSMILLGIISGLAIVRLATTFGAHGNFTLISASLEIAIKQILSYLIILIPLIIGFTIAALNLFGPHVLAFSNFQDSFVSMLLFGLGQIDSTVFTQSSSSVVAIIFFTIYYFFIVFFVVTVFAGIYIDSYRLVVMQNGYNMGKDNELKLSGWLLPKFLFNKLKNSYNSMKKKLNDKKQRKEKPLEKERKEKETEMAKQKVKDSPVSADKEERIEYDEDRSGRSGDSSP